MCKTDWDISRVVSLNADTLDQIKSVGKMVKSVGGFGRFREMLDVIRQVGGLKRLRDILDAMAITEGESK